MISTRFLAKAAIAVLPILISFGFIPSGATAGLPKITFEQEGNRVKIFAGNLFFANYVTHDPKISRPYFSEIHTPGGLQVTRNNPPIEGVDLTDHDTYHPGLWFAYGDIGGNDYWRLKAPILHDRFVGEFQSAEGEGGFSVENVYMTEDGKELLRDIRSHRIVAVPGGEGVLGFLILSKSEFFSNTGDFVFGDQEEMGFAVRVTTALNVDSGGEVRNSDGLLNEDGAWGKQADWCDYGGVVDGKRIGVTLFPGPDNFRKSWFHARDYGVLITNPFGRAAYTDGEPSAIPVKKGERFSIEFGAFFYETVPGNRECPLTGYETYLDRRKP